MLGTTYKRVSGRTLDHHRRARRGLQGAAATVIAAGVVAVAGCGSSSSTTSTTVDSAAVTAFQKAGNAVCQKAVADVKPLTARMAAVEKNKQLPTLADTKALDAAQAAEQKALAKLPAPASLSALKAQADNAFATVVARIQALLRLHGDQAIAYDAIDPQLAQATSTLDAKFKALGLNSCA